MVTIEPIDARYSARATKTHLLVAITFHFAADRLGYLEQVLSALAEFAVESLQVVVFTNTTAAAEQEALRRIFHEARLAEEDSTIATEVALPHPFDLAWSHKRLIVEKFLATGSHYTHFVYLEDDERLIFENFTYFIAARELLRPFDLVPAFLRTEWSSERGCYVNTDNIAPVDLSRRRFVSAGDTIFVNIENPYCGAFILDRELAREYAASRSIDRDRSREVNSNWGVRERAAMGLTFEDPPYPFFHRVVVPISMGSQAVPQCAWLAHLPNNYAEDPKDPLGKVGMNDLFSGEIDAKFEVRLTLRRKLKTLRRKFARSFLGRSLLGKGLGRHAPA